MSKRIIGDDRTALMAPDGISKEETIHIALHYLDRTETAEKRISKVSQSLFDAYIQHSPLGMGFCANCRADIFGGEKHSPDCLIGISLRDLTGGEMVFTREGNSVTYKFVREE